MTFPLVTANRVWMAVAVGTALFLNFREWGVYNLFWWEHLFLSC